MISTTVMIQKLEGCVGTGDLTDWEQRFVLDLVARLKDGDVTKLSAKQVDVLERLHDKYFA